MPESHAELYVHLVWATWDRMPLLSQDIRDQVFTAIGVKCKELNCIPLAVGGIDNHVHVLLRFPTTITIASLAHEIKGSSSHLITHVLKPGTYFKWQGSYGAFTIHTRDVEHLQRYIQNQERHHADQVLDSDWEDFMTRE